MNQETPTPPRTRPDPAAWVDEHGDYLYRYALARVVRPDVAEDLVQETFLAALRNLANFAGRSSERTWLTSILKSKLIDRLRQQHRVALASDLAQSDTWLDEVFSRKGFWRRRAVPGQWGKNPLELLEQQEFWQAFEECRAALPDRLREVLSLRLLDEVPTDEICQTLGISPNNLWTLLHRARVRLWHCLDRKGLGEHLSRKKS
jgi:RNA polymerase sigma-70 factor (ECF subfamily)